MQKELDEIESDMMMLRETLASKNRRANEIRKELGLTQMDVFLNTFNDGLAKTGQALHTAKDKTVEFANNVR
ncbi:hypothetical protein Ciccas_003570 [Cichlidogyrus casuarinus]|uniref:Uncharacterized protein n=1 Tax=Cichlidogyrus casuarinus TaxID=1844966 RepID=A0ABD2QHB4_9PLAT